MEFSLTDNKVVNFLKEVQIELKKVVWPTRKETVKFTLIIIGISLSVALFLGILDLIFTKVLEILIR